MPAVKDVLERFRQDIVSQLRADGFKVPPEADTPGNCSDALTSWFRIQHRSVPATPRKVHQSAELQLRNLDATTRARVTGIRSEFSMGQDLTQRLTRQFYKGGFNDFLYNTFGIQHIHLGPPGGAQDKTRQHLMAVGSSDVLLVLIRSQDVYFLDVLDHGVFKSPSMTKALLQLTMKNWPDLLESIATDEIEAPSVSFEQAFCMAKAGLTTRFEVDGASFFPGFNVLDGTATKGVRTACTSWDVAAASDRMLNRIVALVKYATAQAGTGESALEGEPRPSSGVLQVVRADAVIVIREHGTGRSYFHDGCCLGRVTDKSSS